MRRVLLLGVLLTLSGCFGDPDGAPPSPPPADVDLDDAGFTLTLLVDDLEAPLLVTHAGDGSGRLFIAEQGGRVLVLENGTTRTFLDVSDRTRAEGERGFLGLAFDPDFTSNGRFYTHYSDLDGDTTLSRFTVDGRGVGDPATEEVLLKVDQPYGNHNGGQILVGPDGYLWMGLGDGGAGGDPHNNGQDPTTLLGSILRLTLDGEPAPGNPFSGTSGDPRVYVYGLRNPWRFSFDPAVGGLYVADVGQGEMEEVTYLPPRDISGANLGWNVWEGVERFRPGTAGGAVFPATTYTHDGGHCSVTGGHVYRGAGNPNMTGIYVYGDYCSGVVWGLAGVDGEWRSRQLADTEHRISSFGLDEAGEVYLVDHGGGVYRLDPPLVQN